MGIFRPEYSWIITGSTVPVGYQTVKVSSGAAGAGGILYLPSVSLKEIGIGNTITIVDPSDFISNSQGIRIRPNTSDSGYTINGSIEYNSYSKGSPITLEYTGNSSWVAYSGESNFSRIKNIYVNFDGGGSAITTGLQCDLPIEYDMEIIQWEVLSDAVPASPGSIEIDIWRDTYANFPPTSLSSIIGTSNFPSIVNGIKGSSSPTGWNSVYLSSGDTLRFNVNSCSVITRAILLIKCTLTS